MIVLLVALHNIFTWIFHATYSCGTSERNRIHSLSVWALTLIMLTSINYVIVPYFTAFNNDAGNIPLTAPLCKWIFFALKMCFIYSKTIGLYYAYIERLFLIFQGNVYAFDKWQIWSLRGMLVLLTLIWTASGLFVDKIQFIEESNTCSPILNQTTVFLFVVADFAVSNLITVLYCRRLLIFISRLNTRFLPNAPGPNAPHQEADRTYFKVMVKSTVLTFVASISTQVTCILCAVMGVPSLWVALDSAFNSWCLILIFDLYDDLFNLYPCCCCLCEKLMCYHCIVCCSCHCCCRVELGAQQTGSNNLRPEIRSNARQTGTDRGSSGDGGANGENTNNVELQLAVSSRHSSSTPTAAVPNALCSNIGSSTVTVEI